MMIDRVGRELTAKHGKQKSYTPPQIQSAASNVGYPIDVHCWAMCVFMSQSDFAAYHDSIGESCNYDLMRGTMLDSLGVNLPFKLPQINYPDLSFVNFSIPDINLPSFNLPEINLPDISWPEIDLSSFFDWS